MKDFVLKASNPSPAEMYNKSLSDGKTSDADAFRAIEALRVVKNNETLSKYLARKEEKI